MNRLSRILHNNLAAASSSQLFATSVTMLQSKAASKALQFQCLPRAQARRFSTTSTTAAISPAYTPNRTQKQNPQTQSPAKRSASATARHSAQAVAHTATKQRAVPSPAFNRESTLQDVQPLQPFRQPEMDHSFVGMNGGQIFHEMMLRHGVKHICE